jgi:ribosomal protein S18 acetylase RimI-like enzyme
MPQLPDRIEIRSAGPADAEALVNYMTALVAERLDTITRRIVPSVEQEREWIAKTLENPHSLIMIALDGPRVIGLLDIQAGSRAVDDHAGILGISVAGDRRGKGVGRRLIEAAIARARTRPGFCRIELLVVARNEGAIHLYESLGFVREGLKRKGINLRGEPEDDLAMALVW